MTLTFVAVDYIQGDVSVKDRTAVLYFVKHLEVRKTQNLRF